MSRPWICGSLSSAVRQAGGAGGAAQSAIGRMKSSGGGALSAEGGYVPRSCSTSTRELYCVAVLTSWTR